MGGPPAGEQSWAPRLTARCAVWRLWLESRGGQMCAWESVRVHPALAPRRAAGAVPLPGPRQRLGAVLQPSLLAETSGDCQAHTPPGFSQCL